MRKLLIGLLFLSTATAVADDTPLIGHGKYIYGSVQKMLLRAAETMPEENYAFKPAETVRTFGQA